MKTTTTISIDIEKKQFILDKKISPSKLFNDIIEKMMQKEDKDGQRGGRK